MGITAGDTVLMHSAFRVFNGFEGTPDQVIECVLNVIGAVGKLSHGLHAVYAARPLHTYRQGSRLMCGRRCRRWA